jgi:hypothetical protein
VGIFSIKDRNFPRIVSGVQLVPAAIEGASSLYMSSDSVEDGFLEVSEVVKNRVGATASSGKHISFVRNR